jgi:hypothetical protein
MYRYDNLIFWAEKEDIPDAAKTSDLESFKLSKAMGRVVVPLDARLWATRYTLSRQKDRMIVDSALVHLSTIRRQRTIQI